MGYALEAPRGYTLADFEFALSAVAFHGGNTQRALDAMKEMAPEDLAALGVKKIPNERSMLHQWKKRYAARYAELRDKQLEPYRLAAAEAHSALADEHMRVNKDTLDELESDRSEMTHKDKIALLNHTGVQSGIHRDKAAGLRGESQGGVNIQVNIGDQIRGLAAKGAVYDESGKQLTAEEALAKAIPSTATELPKENESARQ